MSELCVSISILAVALTLLGCDANKGGAQPTASAASIAAAAPADVPCDAVVAKLLSVQREGFKGDAEKKLFTKMCAEMSKEMKACIAGSTTQAEVDACVKKKGDDKAVR